MVRGWERGESLSRDLGGNMATGREELTNPNDKHGVHPDYICSHRAIITGSLVHKHVFYILFLRGGGIA